MKTKPEFPIHRRTAERLIDEIPTSWLDELLTGPNAVLSGKGGTWGCPDIERLLNAIRERQRRVAGLAELAKKGEGE